MDKYITFYSSLHHEQMNPDQYKVFQMLMREYAGVYCSHPIKYDVYDIKNAVIISKDLQFVDLNLQFTAPSNEILFSADFSAFDFRHEMITQIQSIKTAVIKLKHRVAQALDPDYYETASYEEIFNKHFK